MEKSYGFFNNDVVYHLRPWACVGLGVYALSLQPTAVVPNACAVTLVICGMLIVYLRSTKRRAAARARR